MAAFVRGAAIGALVSAAAADDHKCPGSGATVHAWAEVDSVVAASCAEVMEEMKARISAQGGRWHDPHNNGKYAVLRSGDNELLVSRTSGAASVLGKTYTDKVLFTLAPDNAHCKVSACSESQGFSVGDFSTNYCNIRNLYCGSSAGCSPVTHDFMFNEVYTSKSMGASIDATKCVVTPAISVGLASRTALTAKASSSSYKCPGSGSTIHASCTLDATAATSCADVMAEMQARVSSQGHGWHDPHNNGKYTFLSKGENELGFIRTSGNKSFGGKTYTDKVMFQFSVNEKGGCDIKGCSESQGFSVKDFSTNYCNMRNLYCNKAEGCSPVQHDFATTESHVSPSIGASADASACVVAASSDLSIVV